uniref:Beta-actin n=1 Tax=Dolomedes sulfureus TaxID=492288 RepID=A0A0P0CW07_9ARAC|nr:beta-actin [Dolomedes sulfureus]
MCNASAHFLRKYLITIIFLNLCNKSIHVILKK